EGGALLEPLLTAALDGALRGGDSALTGPIARGDAGTVAEHRDRLARLDGPEVADVLPSYLALARATTSRALATGRIGERRAAELLDVLTGEPSARAEPPRTPGRPALVHTISELRTLLPAGRRGGAHRRAVVMTM